MYNNALTKFVSPVINNATDTAGFKLAPLTLASVQTRVATRKPLPKLPVSDACSESAALGKPNEHTYKTSK